MENWIAACTFKPCHPRAIMDDIVKDFLIESNENLDRLDQELVKLESDPSSKELLGSIFRTIHTIKGSCSFLGFARLEKLAHAGESLLARLRDGELCLTEEVTSGLLAMVDAVRLMLAAIERTEQDGEEDYAALIERLAALQRRTSEPPVPPAHRTPTSPNPGEESSDPSKIDPSPEACAETVRVGVNLLDRLMNLVGELVLARNQLMQFTSSRKDAEFQALSQRMNLVTGELQQEVMKTRMQPIGNAWNKFPRVVRDLALNCGKEVRLEMEGQDTELDRSILEAVRDPLTHLVRNSIDHGIELPEARRQAGKEASGLLRLRAFHADGQVNLEVSDDGAGLNRERIAQKAVECGLVSAAQAAHLPDRDICNLIFLPGFSTAEKVTAVSGRGVGMDVVKTSVEKIGGAVDVESAAGKGTTVRIRIPLTLAIIPALMVNSGGERFAIPQVSLRELVRHDPSTSGPVVEMVHSAPVYRLRGRLLALIYLNRELALTHDAQKDAADSLLNIVVVHADGREFGLVVDEIVDTEEIVVKPLGKQLNGITAFSGATVMGDGHIALILDIVGLARRARILSEAGEAATKESEKLRPAKASGSQPQSLLVIDCRDRSRVAIPLSLVARLEELPASGIEFAGGQEVTQYRGQIMPLVRFPHVVSKTSAQEVAAGPEGVVQVVVCSESGRIVGIIVDGVLDIINEEEAAHDPSSRDFGRSSIIQGRVTEMLDLSRFLQEMLPHEPVAGAWEQ